MYARTASIVMASLLDPWNLFQVIDVLGVFIGAFTATLVARRMRYDITGMWTLALVAGLGGGIIRDICLQAGPPLALTEPAYLPAVAVATFAGAIYGGKVDHTWKSIVFLDTLALITFAVAGSLRTLQYDYGIWATALLGVITAVGGGVLRDVLSGETPMIFRRAELYALAALGASLAIIMLELLNQPRGIMALGGYAVGLFLRFGSLRWGWMSWAPRAPDERAG
jgi:uncharacterized membrane protein YeiH